MSQRQSMSGHDVLDATATLVRRGWCCGAAARDFSGEAVAAYDPAATAWSLTGALALVSERADASLGALSDALWGISGVIEESSLDAWNDSTGRTQVQALRMLDEASCSLTRDPPPDGAVSLN